MSTWWKSARRADLGLGDTATNQQSFAITNRGWYILYSFLKALRVEGLDTLAGKGVLVPTNLARLWGNAILSADMDRWFQLGEFDGEAVVPVGIVHESEATKYLNSHELVPLAGTPLGAWLLSIGQELALAPSGLVISGKPQRGSMSVNLVKGAKTDLVKEAGGSLTKVRVGLGWDVRKTTGEAYDLDASVITAGSDGHSIGADWFVHYNNLRSPDGVITHQGDELTGGKEGDDEQITIDLAKLPDNAQELHVVVTIYEAAKRGNQSFSLVDNAFVRIIDDANGTELARYDLTEDTDPGVNALVFGKLYRHNGTWNFKAIGDGFTDELDGLARAYHI